MTWLQTSVALSMKGFSAARIQEQKAIYRSMDRIVSLSRGVKDSFVEMFPELEDKVVVAYHPMDVSNIVTKGEASIDAVKPSRPLLVSVGRMTWAKGYDRYLRALKRLKDKGYEFEAWIVGGGERGEFEKYCTENSLDNVRFWGNQDNPYPFMKMADWFVLPSYVEGFGTVSMEALALGRAVLVTRCPASGELLGDSEYGLVVENEEDALVAGLEKALTDPVLKTRYEATARERAALFDVDACLEKIEEALDV